MKKALCVLERLKRFYNNNKQDYLAEFTIDIDDYNKIEDGILELNATCDTCKYLAKDKGWYCENFGFRCSSAGFEEHMPDDGYCCNRYENDN